ncbi:hypothetical protein [Pseudanabaena sp. 'Roaring Creek']|uniref:hypothetical protein n=1 Tax=Pseudanabaena sp. 'Roaring Creek' TaxID=1681830 RepID=UPI0006D84EDA|nr:hypothetical protein [Pseudanabaena sp. 'Roaring Creek']
MSKYIIYKAKPDQLEGASDRKLTHCNRFTDILYTKLDFSPKPIPKKGDRPIHPVTVKESLSPDQLEDGTTHSRKSDWVVDSVEFFTTSDNTLQFDAIVICWCVYAPILNPVLTPVVNGDKRDGKTFEGIERTLISV